MIPPELISAFTVKFKLFLRNICLQGATALDVHLDPALQDKWNIIATELVTSPVIKIKRLVKSLSATGPPRLVTLSDGSLVAFLKTLRVEL